jgi:prepilin-type N-terminal cleavage/methylation domain-containing protein
LLDLKNVTRARGFTIIELLIVVSMLAVLTAIVVVPVRNYYKSRKLRASIDQFRSTYQRARMMAVRYGGLSELIIDGPTATFWVEMDTSGTGKVDTIGQVRDVSTVYLTMETDRKRLCFDARGIPWRGKNGKGVPCQKPEGTVTFRLLNDSMSVSITALGKLSR